MSDKSSPPPDLIENELEAKLVAAEELEGKALGDLGDLELEYEKAEVEISKMQIKLTEPLNKRRNELTSIIPNFWPIVLDTYGPEFDSHVAPQDTQLMTLITGVNVIRTNPTTEPRDFSIELNFDEKASAWFEESTLAKTFWWRTMETWSGIVSEPVKITWKKGKDLTSGETDLAWEEHVSKGKKKSAAKQKNGKTLEERMGGGQPSFFAWFAWKGRGRDDPAPEEDEEDEETDVFSHGDELALTICDDLYPNATKYFIEALQGEGDSDANSDSDSDDEGMIELDIDEEEDNLDDLEDVGLGGSGGIKRVDIELSGSGSDSEDPGEPLKKKAKTG